MAKFKIEVDQEACIGCGACSVMCADHFEQVETSSGNKAKVLKADEDVITCPQEAAGICPVNAIHITETESGKKLI